MLELETFGNNLVLTVLVEVFTTAVGKTDELRRYRWLIEARIAQCQADGIVGEFALIRDAESMTCLIGIRNLIGAVVHHAAHIDSDLMILFDIEWAGRL